MQKKPAPAARLARRRPPSPASGAPGHAVRRFLCPHQKGLIMAPINLRMLVPGQKANILKISALGELGRRIRDMGLVPGTQLEVIGKAPLRDPVALRIEGTTIALRNSEADHITVEVVE